MPEHKDWKVQWSKTRLEALREAGETPRMPDLSIGGDYIKALLRLGPLRSTEMGGQRSVDWPEITAFAQGTQRVSAPWEIELLYDLAQEYAAGHRTGCKLFGIEPMEKAEEQDE